MEVNSDRNPAESPMRVSVNTDKIPATTADKPSSTKIAYIPLDIVGTTEVWGVIVWEAYDLHIQSLSVAPFLERSLLFYYTKTQFDQNVRYIYLPR